MNGRTSREPSPGPFRPAPWLPGPHLQTIGAAVLPSPGPASTERQVFELSDGDFIEANWTLPRRPGRPLVVILHGLEGSADSPYARRLAAATDARGWQSVVLQARGCGREPNRLPRGYHAGETGDLAEFLDSLAQANRPPTATVGYSLGGNVLLKYLGERGPFARLDAAVAVSVPYDLGDSSTAVDRGLARLYRDRLLRLMKKRLREGIRSGRLGGRWAQALAARDFRSFDDLFTAPVHGFSGVKDYYDRCSCGPFVAAIRRETLLIHALDDPFTTPVALPDPAGLPARVTLEVSPGGGHVGFVCGGTPWRPRFWLEERILAFLGPRLGNGRSP